MQKTFTMKRPFWVWVPISLLTGSAFGLVVQGLFRLLIVIGVDQVSSLVYFFRFTVWLSLPILLVVWVYLLIWLWRQRERSFGFFAFLLRLLCHIGLGYVLAQIFWYPVVRVGTNWDEEGGNCEDYLRPAQWLCEPIVDLFEAAMLVSFGIWPMLPYIPVVAVPGALLFSFLLLTRSAAGRPNG